MDIVFAILIDLLEDIYIWVSRGMAHLVGGE